jgi:hypothetical protein
MALMKPAAGQARRRRPPATSEPPASAAPRSRPHISPSHDGPQTDFPAPKWGQNGIDEAGRWPSPPQALTTASERLPTRSPLPLPRRAPDRISRHFSMGLNLKLIFRPRNGVKMALTNLKPAAGQAGRRRPPATSEPPASAAPRSRPDISPFHWQYGPQTDFSGPEMGSKWH